MAPTRGAARGACASDRGDRDGPGRPSAASAGRRLGRRERWRRLAWAAALASIFPAAGILQPWLARDLFPVCAFCAVTGHPCPFCGLTRALAHAVRGDLAAASIRHPLWPLFAALILFLAALFAAEAAANRTLWPATARGARARRNLRETNEN